MDMENSDIIENIIRGNEKAFELIFHKYFQRLFNFAKAYVIDKEVAKEIIQESYMKIWEIRSRLKPESNPEALLFTLVRNIALNYLKHRLIERKYLQTAKQQNEIHRLHYVALKNDVIEKLYSAEIQAALNRAIENLPTRCRQVFKLSRIENLANKEIASKLNISVKTVENQITAALKRIRPAIREYL